jgi:sodium/hydrogen exchanger 8
MWHNNNEHTTSSSSADVIFNATIIKSNSSITIIEDTNTNETIVFSPPTLSPTAVNINAADEAHQFDADAALLLNITLICCTMLAYYVKKNKFYFMPESAVAMLVGVFIGGLARLTVTDLTLFSFSPELFFFVLLPPIIFEAGYGLEKKGFFDNIGAICLYAFGGTIISAFAVGFLTFTFARNGLIGHVDKDNAMEALLFGALISAVDPVATLSIMGSPELQCDTLLYSLVFGESVLNDAVAIVLFKTFRKYYNQEGPNLDRSVITAALFSFFTIAVLSILIGASLGLLVSYIYKHTSVSEFPKLEASLLYLFCYLCYATAEAFGLSGIMSLFFNGVVLSHYNSYNLSATAQLTTEQFFATVAVTMETIVFLYMGMGVFTGRFQNWDIMFSFAGLLFCLVARALNIFPLSLIANCCRKKGDNRISLKMQCVLWFAGLRGAVSFALSMNMPGPNSDSYATATLFICMFTTIVCGGFTERILTRFGMKQGLDTIDEESDTFVGVENLIVAESQFARRLSEDLQERYRSFWHNFDDIYMKELFGGDRAGSSDSQYQLSPQNDLYDF